MHGSVRVAHYDRPHEMLQGKFLPYGAHNRLHNQEKRCEERKVVSPHLQLGREQVIRSSSDQIWVTQQVGGSTKNRTNICVAVVIRVSSNRKCWLVRNRNPQDFTHWFGQGRKETGPFITIQEEPRARWLMHSAGIWQTEVETIL